MDPVDAGELVRTNQVLRVWLIGLAATVAACGGSVSTQDTANVLPYGAHDPRGYTEAFLAAHPAAVLRPSHLAILTLEPTQGADDTGDAPGEDSVPYFFDQPGALMLSIDASADQVGSLVLRNGRGASIVRVESGSATVQVTPGLYRLEVHHVRAGDSTAPRQTVFLRPGMQGAAAAGLMLQATSNCMNCDYDNMNITNQDFNGLNLSGSTFHTTAIVSSTFRNATLVGCDFSGTGSESLSAIEESTFTGANLTAAHLDFVGIRQSAFGGEGAAAGANLTQATFGRIEFGFPFFTGIFESDFRNATLSEATFVLPLGSGTSHFEGADLSNTTFTIPAEVGGPPSELGDCTFGLEPVSGRLTSFAGAVLGQTGALALMLSANTDLSGVDFTGAQFVDGTFQNLIFKNAIFDQANLTGANLDGSVFDGARFPGATLTGASLTDASLVGAHLEAAMGAGGTMLPAATLDETTLNGANAYTANLQGVSLVNASLIGANLDFADLSTAALTGARLGVPADSEGSAASLVGAYMPNADLSSADLRGVDLSGAHIYGDAQESKLTGALLDGADLSGAICSGSEFTNASLTGTSFNGAQLVNCRFSGADLTRTKFDCAYLQGASFAGAATVVGAHLDNAAVSTMAGSWTYTEQNGMPVVYSYGPTQLGAFATDSSVTCPDTQNGPCTSDKLNPYNSGPFPPIPTCVPLPPNYNNCNPPVPPATPTPMTPRRDAALR